MENSQLYIKCREKFKNFLSFNNKLIIIVSFIAGLITHFCFFTNEVEAPDTLHIGKIHISSSWEDSLGRWGIKAMDYFRGGLINSFLITVICIFILSIVTIIIVKLLKIKNPVIITILSILVVTSPQLAETLLFTFTADSYCLAMLFSTLSVWFMYRDKSKKDYIGAILFLVLTLSLYQSYIGVTATLCVIIPILNLIQASDAKVELKHILKTIIIGITSVVIYYGTTQLILALSGNELSSYSGANQIGISTIKNFVPETLNTYKTFYRYFFKENFIYNKYWHRDIMNFIIATFTAINLIIIIIQKKTYKKKINIFISIIMLLILPIAVNIINIIAPERDNNLVMGMSYILIYVFALATVSLLKFDKKYIDAASYINLLAIISLCITFIFSNNATYMARKEVFNHYYATSTRILNRIENYEGYNKNTTVLIGGIIEYKSSLSKLANGFISNNAETWRNYDGVLMINKFYYWKMGTTIKLCSKDDYIKIIDSQEYKQMPIFPNDGCIKMIDGILVVKLQENPVRN